MIHYSHSRSMVDFSLFILFQGMSNSSDILYVAAGAFTFDFLIIHRA